MSVLDQLPVATLISIAAIIGGIIALVNNSITFEQFMLAIGATVGGSGVLGVARAQSGKGVKKP